MSVMYHYTAHHIPTYCAVYQYIVPLYLSNSGYDLALLGSCSRYVYNNDTWLPWLPANETDRCSHVRQLQDSTASVPEIDKFHNLITTLYWSGSQGIK